MVEALAIAILLWGPKFCALEPCHDAETGFPLAILVNVRERRALFGESRTKVNACIHMWIYKITAERERERERERESEQASKQA